MVFNMYDDLVEVRFSDDDDENAEARWATLFVHGHQVAIDEGLLIPMKIPFGEGVTEV